MKNGYGAITFIGSGELGEAMAKVHRSLLARLQPPVHAVFLDTPAGFEVNVDEISAKAVEYFQRHFNVPLTVASFRSRRGATTKDVEATLHALYRANFIFAGPGSPTYAIRSWRHTKVWDTVQGRWMAGAQLVFASAASIAVGYRALPVYETYKAGHDPHWVDGLDLLDAFGLKLAIVPHWNNVEGGTYDTRFCFMGEARLKTLEGQLPFDVAILGINEHTAFTLDLGAQQGIVDGVGQVTVRHAGREWNYPAGATVSLETLRADKLASAELSTPIEAAAPAPASGKSRGTRRETRMPSSAPQLVKTTLYLDQLARAIEETGDQCAEQELIAHTHEAMHELPQVGADNLTLTQDITPFVELLISLRSQLREAKQFALADQVRERLRQLGILPEDTPSGTRWKTIR